MKRPLLLLLLLLLVLAAAGGLFYLKSETADDSPSGPRKAALPPIGPSSLPSPTVDLPDDSNADPTLKLKRIYESSPEEPPWVSGAEPPPPGSFAAVGKGSSTKNVFEAQFLSLREAVKSLVQAHLGKDLSSEAKVDWSVEKDRTAVRLKGVVWIDGESRFMEKLTIEGSYVEAFEGPDGASQVVTVWSRVLWAEEELLALRKSMEN